MTDGVERREREREREREEERGVTRRKNGGAS